MHYGARSGLFARYGLNVTVTSVNNGAAAAAAVIGGDADVAMANVLTLIQAYRRGVAMRMIAPNYLESSDKPTVAVLVLKESPLRTARDLAGKTVGAPGLVDAISIGMRAWIEQNGADAKAVRFVEMPIATTVAMLESSRADAVGSIEPFVTQAMSSGKLRVLTYPMAALGARLQLGSYIVMEPNVEKKLDAMTRLARALHEASAFTSTHPAETVELVASYSGATPETVAKMNREVDPEYCDPRLIQPVINALAKYGGIDQAFPAAEIISTAALKPPR
jgi:NitT/TauT family transport system substrate-binding protein